MNIFIFNAQSRFNWCYYLSKILNNEMSLQLSAIELDALDFCPEWYLNQIKEISKKKKISVVHLDENTDACV